MNIVDLPKGLPKEGSPESLKKDLDSLRSKLPFIFEFAEVSAQIARKKYLVLVANGFTETQAIELLKGTL